MAFSPLSFHSSSSLSFPMSTTSIEDFHKPAVFPPFYFDMPPYFIPEYLKKQPEKPVVKKAPVVTPILPIEIVEAPYGPIGSNLTKKMSESNTDKEDTFSWFFEDDENGGFKSPVEIKEKKEEIKVNDEIDKEAETLFQSQLEMILTYNFNNSFEKYLLALRPFNMTEFYIDSLCDWTTSEESSISIPLDDDEDEEEEVGEEEEEEEVDHIKD